MKTTEAAPDLTLAAHPPGMGAVVQAAGVSFRVWAPFAEKVSVIGSFNDWQEEATPLSREGETGYWFVVVPQAKAGNDYQYLLHHQGQILRKNDPYARKISPESHRGVIVGPAPFDWGQDAYTLPDYNHLVIYELHVGTFSKGKDGKPGTFAGLQKRLHYLQQLGVNAIELMPLAEFPSEKSWGYNITNPFAIEESYGGADALKEFIKAAHAINIAVIIDVVYNHYGPDDLDLWQFDGWQENNLGGIYFYNDWRAWTPWGQNRPDYGRSEVRQYLRDNALMWLEEFRVDGLRFDGVSYIRSVRGDNDPTGALAHGWQLLQWINEEIHRLYPKRITIAEDLQNNPWLTKTTGEGGAGFYTQWDVVFVHPVREAVILSEDHYRNLNAVKDSLTHHYNGDPFQRVIYSESHDEVANGRARVPFEIDPQDAGGFYARKRSTLAASLVFTSPGIPMLFSGQELLEDEWFRDDVPIDWSKLTSFRGIHRLYRDLIHLRRNVAGVTSGLIGPHIEVNHINYEAKLLTYHRWLDGGPGDDVLVVANFSNQTFNNYAFGCPHPGMWKVRFNSDWEGYSQDFDSFPSFDTEAQEEPLHGKPCRALLNIGAYALVILSQDLPTVKP
jgi:1,4-alpha-glucan branching enzyme